MSGIAVHNVAGAPLVIDTAGHVLGIDEYAALVPDGRTTALLTARSLLQVTGDPTDVHLDTRASAALTAALTVVAPDLGIASSSPARYVDGGTP